MLKPQMKIVSILLLCLTLSGCGILFPWPEGNYPVTSFYVKNASEKAIDFQSTVVKQSNIIGQHEMTVPFTVNPRDSILVRQVGFKKDAKPNEWFVRFRISPTEGVEIHDPRKPGNWKKGSDRKGKPTFTFTIAE